MIKIITTALTLLTANAFSNEFIDRGCIRNGKNWTCPREGCTTKYNSGATDKIEFLCNPMRMFFNANIYDESGPFRHIYNKEKYDELVKKGSAGTQSVINPDFDINSDPSKTKEAYSKEPYSITAHTNKVTEIASVLWTFQEFQKQCVPSDGKNTVLNNWYKEMNDVTEIYKSAVAKLKSAQEKIKKNSENAKNPQIAAIQFQIDSYKLNQNFLYETPGVVNYNNVLKKIMNATNNDFFNAESQDHNIVRYFSANLGDDTIDKAIATANNACNSSIRNCKTAADMLQNIKQNILIAKYAAAYYQKRVTSEALDQSLVAAEEEAIANILKLPDPTNNNYDWKTPVLAEMQSFIARRKSYGVVCPANAAEANLENGKVFLTNLGIEPSAPNLDVMKGIWAEVDLHVGEPNQRIIMFSRIRQFALQVFYWNIKTIGEIEKNITKLEETKRATRKSLGLPEYETEAEAKARISSYLLKSSNFLGIKQYSTKVWYAEIKQDDGKTISVKLDYSGPESVKNLCYGIIEGGC